MDIHGERYWWYTGKKAFINRLLRGVTLPQPGRVLDLGCGAGTLLGFAESMGRVTGMELSRNALTLARRRFRGDLVQASSMAAPFRAGSFSVICLFDSLEHFEDDRAALDQVHEMLTENGAVIISVPAFNWLRTSRDDQLCHFRRYTRTSLSRLLHAAGFDLLNMFYGYFCLTLPVALQALKERWLGPPKQLPSDIKQLPEPFNGILAGWLSGEAQVAGRFGLPLGTSLFAVARRRKAAP